MQKNKLEIEFLNKWLQTKILNKKKKKKIPGALFLGVIISIEEGKNSQTAKLTVMESQKQRGPFFWHTNGRIWTYIQ